VGGRQLDTVADVNHRREEEKGSDEPAKLGRALEGTATRRAFKVSAQMSTDSPEPVLLNDP
jgi:hypothetical protein